MNFTRLSLLIAIALLAAAGARGGDAKAPANVERLFAAGQVLQRAAAATAATDPDSQDLVTRNYQAAIDRYAKALKLQPDFYRARAAWAQCLLRLARQQTNQEQRRETLAKAQEQFRLAGKSREADWTLSYEWAQAWTFEAEGNGSSAAYNEAIRLYELALKDTSQIGDHARVERDLAACFLQAARKANEPIRRRALYEQSVQRFEAVSKVEAQASKPGFYGLWGVALVELGRLDGNRLILRQAIDELNVAATRDAENPEPQYNLACAHALLNETDAAMRHLRLCFEHDPKRNFYNSAVQDRDFDSLRVRRDFNDLFGDTPPSSSSMSPLIPDH